MPFTIPMQGKDSMPFTIATFNVNGIRARKDLLLNWIRAASPEVLCLQETKAQEKDFPFSDFEELGYHVAYRGQKSFNGVALLSRQEISQVVTDLPGDTPEAQARVVAAQVAGIQIFNTYVPQGQEVGAPAFEHKLEFLGRVKSWLAESFSPDQPLIWLGDLNIAPTDMDVHDPKRMEGKVTCHPEERRLLKEIMDWGLTDLFRLHHPDKVQYTFWDYRLPASFKRNLGWRIDFILATKSLAGACHKAWVDTEPRGLNKPSDHTPMLAELDWPAA
jgi:exodeoxyribonuclease-3